ncbi:MAG: cache domain-containing protein [Verrucomicrobia bacterium]|nr:cache domain-containing protein [Verrucomicrobiota bacterium]
MRVPFLRSLPVRLAGLILILSGLTLLVFTEVNRRAVERILIEQAEVQAATSTTAVVDGLDAVIGSVERLARFLARDLEGRPLTPTEVETIARNVLLDSPNVHGCSITFESKALNPTTDRFGLYVHRSTGVNRYVARDLGTPEQSYWTRDWYREALERGQPVWSEPFFDRGGSDRNVVRVAVPFFRMVNNERQPVGVVAAIIELDWLRRLANANEFSDTCYTIIFSRSGRLIIHPKPTYVIAETVETLAEKENTPELARIRQNVLAKRQGSMRYSETSPARRVHVNYKPTKVAGWGVIVGYDEEDFLKTQRAFRGITAIFVGSLLAMLAGIVILITRYALRPLGQLAIAADEIAKRNLDSEIAPPRRDDEVGRLTQSFRSMRDALKAQHLERRWAGQAIEHQLRYNQLIIDSVSELVFVLTKALNISRVNPAVLRMTGFTETELIKAPLGRLVSLVPPAAEMSAPTAEILAVALKEGRSQLDLPAILTDKNGLTTPVILTLVPLRDDNRVVGGVATLRRAPARSKTL